MTATYNGKIAAIHNIGQGKLVETGDGELFLVDENDVEVLEWDGQTAHVPSLTTDEADIMELSVGGDESDEHWRSLGTFDEFVTGETSGETEVSISIPNTDISDYDMKVIYRLETRVDSDNEEDIQLRMNGDGDDNGQWRYSDSSGTFFSSQDGLRLYGQDTLSVVRPRGVLELRSSGGARIGGKHLFNGSYLDRLELPYGDVFQRGTDITTVQSIDFVVGHGDASSFDLGARIEVLVRGIKL